MPPFSVESVKLFSRLMLAEKGQKEKQQNRIKSLNLLVLVSEIEKKACTNLKKKIRKR